MSKSKSDGKKKKKKSSQLVIRIEQGERDDFVKLCDTLDTSAAREIRRFMRDWVAAHAPQTATADAPTPDEPKPAAPVPDAPESGEETADAPTDKRKRKRAIEGAD